jgi:hypothetical protein
MTPSEAFDALLVELGEVSHDEAVRILTGRYRFDLSAAIERKIKAGTVGVGPGPKRRLVPLTPQQTGRMP